MPKVVGADAFYPAAELFVNRSLRDGSSFVTGEVGVWTLGAADDFYERFVVNEDIGDASFIDKLIGQLAGAPRGTLLFAADLVCVCALPIHDMGVAAKLKWVQPVLEQVSPPAELHPSLLDAFATGIASYGVAKTQVWKYMRYLAEFARAWTSLDGDSRTARLADAWAFKGFLAGVPGGLGTQAGALQCLVFPEVFEPIVSVDVKNTIGKRFGGVNGVEEESDADRKLAIIRPLLEETLGPGAHFYSPVIERVWRSSPNERAWTFAEFARRFRELPTFHDEEITYKMELASRLSAARTAVLANDPIWLELLRGCFKAPNNITSWRQHDTFLKWCESNHVESRTALAALWSGASAEDADVSRFLDAVPADAIDSPGGRANIVSYLSGAWNPEDWVNYAATASDRALKLCDRDVAETKDVPERIVRFRSFIDELRIRLLALGARPVTRLEAQGMAWCVVSDTVPDDWPQADRDALVAFRGGNEIEQAVPVPQRAWHFRSFAPHGTRVTEYWLPEGFVSTFWDELGALETGTSLADIGARVREVYPEEPDGRLRAWTGTLFRFLTAMKQGDLVLTTAGQSVYVGRVTGDVEWEESSPQYLFRRRSVAWLNVESPASLGHLSVQLQTGLKQPSAVSRIKQVDEVAALVGLAPEPTPPVTAALAGVTAAVADALFMDIDPLQLIVDLLAEKRQLVFYGPPGTGKTLVAQRLAEHLTYEGGEWMLAQFHPSYAYEDFMEGYRPRSNADGSIGYELRQGPLRRLAEAATEDPGHPYVLIVDEINRGNIPKIFGELLYLLEYRDRPIAIQYSDDAFSLPPNLYLIGTMNTADRSIALVDAALRRRFYFVPFLPTEPPVKHVLRRWLRESERDELPALLLEELNTRIAKDEVALGPSYLMAGDGSHASLKRTWRYAILPLLDEHFYGTKRDVHKELSFEACLAAVTASSSPEAESTAGESGAPPDGEPAKEE